jgi:hypothetical protein
VEMLLSINKIFICYNKRLLTDLRDFRNIDDNMSVLINVSEGCQIKCTMPVCGRDL